MNRQPLLRSALLCLWGCCNMKRVCWPFSGTGWATDRVRCVGKVHQRCVRICRCTMYMQSRFTVARFMHRCSLLLCFRFPGAYTTFRQCGSGEGKGEVVGLCCRTTMSQNGSACAPVLPLPPSVVSYKEKYFTGLAPYIIG